MKKATHIIGLLVTLVICFMAGACHEPLYFPRVPSGEAATLTLSLHTDVPVEISTKGIPEAEERLVNSLYVLIFDHEGNLSSKAEFPTMSSHLIVPSVSGSNMQIYAIANFDIATPQVQLETALDEITTLSQLQAITILQDPSEVITPYDLTMTGNTTTDILPGDNQILLSLKQVAAKITVKIVDATPAQQLSFLGCDLRSLPGCSYLLAQNADAIDRSSYPDGFFDTEEMALWEREEHLSGHSSVSGTFYMMENRAGLSTGYSSYKEKSAHAPQGATYCVSHMMCLNTETRETYSVKMKLYLGGNNSTDFNIQRGHHYTYTITFNGVNDITVNVDEDSNTEAVSIPLSVNLSNSLLFDAHPDNRAFSIRQNIDLSNISIEILDEAKRTYDEEGFTASWLKISPLDLLSHQVSQTDADKNNDGVPDNLYQQQAPKPGSEGYFVRPRYIPHRSYRESHPDEAWSEWPSIDDVDYNDDMLSINDATYRMVYKLTDLLEDAVDLEQHVKVFVYAEEFLYNGLKQPRNAFIRITYTDISDGIERYIDYQVAQLQPSYVGLIVDTYDRTYAGSGTDGMDASLADVTSRTRYIPMVIEEIEEAALIIDPDSEHQEFQQVFQMQWGYSGKQLYHYLDTDNRFEQYRNGYFLTANAVYGDKNNVWKNEESFVRRNNDGSGVDWSAIADNYRPKYGSGEVAYDSYTGILAEPGYTDNHSGYPYYTPATSATPSQNRYYEPRFNSSAARYCHEKNRDRNGDGRITPDETDWFLPSQHELYIIWIALEAIRNTTTEYGTDSYLSSSEEDSNYIHNIGFTSGFNASRKIKKNDTQSVRCARKNN